MKYRLSKAWSLIVNVFILLFFCLYLFSCFHLMIEQLIHNSVLCYIFALIITTLFFLFTSSIYFLIQNRYGVNSLFTNFETVYTNKIRILILLFVLPFLLRIVLLFYFQTPILGDPGVYIDISKEIAFNKVVIRNAEYSSNFPHLFWFGMFLVPAALLSCLGDWIFQVYISLLLCFNSLLVYGIAKTLFKSKRRAFITALIYSYLPSQLFCGLTITHEYAFTFFVFVAIYIYLQKKSLASWLGVCLLLAVARLLNSAGIIIFWGLLFCILFVWNNSVDLMHRFISLLILALIVFLVQFNANFIQRELTNGNVNLNLTSVEWQLYIGGNTETEGRYNIYDVNEINEVVDNASDVAEAKTVLRKLVKDRWMNTINDPLRFASFMLSKFCNVWSGTHYSIELAGHYVSGKTGKYLILALMLINNLIYASFISLSLLGLWKRRKSIEDDVVVFIKTIIIGTGCMLLFTETMNKYSLTMLGPIIILMGYSFVNTKIKENSLSNGSIRTSLDCV